MLLSMIMIESVTARIALLATVLCALSATVVAQQAAATGPPLAVRTSTLDKGFLRQPYRFQLVSDGGITPLHWNVATGALPPGLSLSDDGLLSGTPTAVGNYAIVLTITDSGKPPRSLNYPLTMQIVAPMLLDWNPAPKINGTRVEGGLKVSNQTGVEFDLTVVVMAVAEDGRATAIGYQHFTLKPQTINFPIPFGENLPWGAYQINADAVAEVASTNVIYRARLVSNGRLRLIQGP
jgi:putative Ig domain-containing protein